MYGEKNTFEDAKTTVTEFLDDFYDDAEVNFNQAWLNLERRLQEYFGYEPRDSENGNIATGMTRESLDQAIAEIKDGLGDHMVGDVIREAEKTDGQIGFATDEDDQGPNVCGKWVDMIERVLARHELHRIVMMPFPVKGKLVYVLAGLKTIKDKEEER
jgi:hypothetical protein